MPVLRKESAGQVQGAAPHRGRAHALVALPPVLTVSPPLQDPQHAPEPHEHISPPAPEAASVPPPTAGRGPRVLRTHECRSAFSAAAHSGHCRRSPRGRWRHSGASRTSQGHCLAFPLSLRTLRSQKLLVYSYLTVPGLYLALLLGRYLASSFFGDTTRLLPNNPCISLSSTRVLSFNLI